MDGQPSDVMSERTGLEREWTLGRKCFRWSLATRLVIGGLVGGILGAVVGVIVTTTLLPGAWLAGIAMLVIGVAAGCLVASYRALEDADPTKPDRAGREHRRR